MKLSPGSPRVLVLLVSILGVSGLYRRRAESLHEVMTASELGFYFGGDAGSAEYEVVYMPILVSRSAQRTTDDGGYSKEFGEDETVDYGFNAFGRDMNLRLERNRRLVAPNFKVHKRDSDDGSADILNLDGDNLDCHYLQRNGDFVAAISMCQDQIIHGLVFVDNVTYEIRPLTPRLATYFKLEEALEDESSEDHPNRVPHVVRRATVDLEHFANDYRLLPENDMVDFSVTNEVSDGGEDDGLGLFRTRRDNKARVFTAELALFFDAAAYRIFGPYLNNNDKEIRDMLLAYMNGVQALYHHPSLGTSLELTLVRLELMKNQPRDLPHYDGERSKLLDSFCDYQKRLNPPGDSNPDHWDMGLYISGLDFYAIENGRRSGVTMGLATVGGVCMDMYACVIAELGTTNVFGKPYPSAGFTSVYILAHEIGHNLGMHHDSTGNSCPKEGYIMSPSRGTHGETIWSTCSARVMTNLGVYKCLTDKPGPIPPDRNHALFNDVPGQKWSAKKQCELLLRDKDARVSLIGSSLGDICQQLQCKTPHRSGYYYAGPALEGTDCGVGLWCQGGSCVKMTKKKPSVVHGGWSKWRSSACKSGCISGSKGFFTKTRTCDNPKPVNTDEGCEGNSYEVNICKDDQICGKRKRISVVDYAGDKCREFSQRLPELDQNGFGLQAPHEESRLWMSCAIFCRRADTGSYYTPRIDLNDLGVDPYFPDGTWCHNDGKENYFCIQHHCLPESFKFSKFWGTMGDDVHLLSNAHPHLVTLPPIIQKYLSLGPDGKPLLTNLEPDHTPRPPDDDWSNQDYVELPGTAEGNVDEECEDDIPLLC